MPRKTRAAMRAEAEALNVATESMPVNAEAAPNTPTKADRSPLADIDSNSVDGAASAKDEAEAQTELEDIKASKRTLASKKKKGKPGKKGAKSKENDAGENGLSDLMEPLAKEMQSTAGAEDEVSEAATSEKQKAMTTYDKLEAIVTTPPTRHTQSQLAQDDDHDDTVAEPIVRDMDTRDEQKVLLVEPTGPVTPVNDSHSSIPDLSSNEPNSSSQLDAPTDVAEMTSEIHHLQGGSQEQTCQPAEPAASVSQPRAEDSIDAIDAMEDAFEQVHKMIPQVDITSPEKPAKPEPASKEKLAGAKYATAKMTEAFKARKAAATKGATATSKKPTTTSKPAPARQAAPSNSTVLPSRTTSLSKHNKSASVSSSRKASASEDAKDSKPTDYLASRRRPISMQFPAPAPPARSSKAPTKPTFTLPGEAVAARLKAAREERLKREEEEAQKRREFKARPFRASMAPVAVKPTASSRARESLMHSSETASNKENVGIKRSGSVAGSSAGKRLSTVAPGPASKRASVAIVPGSTTSSNLSKSLHALSAPKRSSVIAPNSSKPRKPTNPSAPASGLASSTSSTATAATAASAAAPSNPAAVRNSYVAGKGREIFNRDRVEKERREQERRDKEEAAKKARLAAAERGRQASREWAEKAKAKKAAEAAARAAGAVEAVPAAAATMGEEAGHARLKAL